MSDTTSKKLIEDITTSTNEKPTESNDNDSVEPKPTGSKRAYLDVKESVDKYKPFMLKHLETKKLKPSETLSKVRDFLPFFKDSTSKLLDAYKENPDELNIENVQEDEEHIEMNLAVVSESESESDEDEEDEEDDDDDDEEEEETESDEDDSKDPLEDINLDIKVKDKTKLTKIRLPKSNSKKPMIKIIDKVEDEDDDDEDYENESDTNEEKESTTEEN